MKGGKETMFNRIIVISVGGSLIVPDESEKTNGEMEPSEKYIYSQRTKAIRLFEKYLGEN